MAKQILRNASIVIDGVNLSDHANQVEISSEKDVQDVTGFGASSREKAIGLGDGSISITLFQDFAAGSVDATLWNIHNGNASAVVVVKADAGAVSATNPSWTMTGILPSYTPLSGSVGEASTIDATFENAAQSGIVRAVA